MIASLNYYLELGIETARLIRAMGRIRTGKTRFTASYDPEKDTLAILFMDGRSEEVFMSGRDISIDEVHYLAQRLEELSYG